MLPRPHRSSLLACSAGLFLLAAASGQASKLSEFEPSPPPTREQREDAKQRSATPIDRFGQEDPEAQPRPFPWPGVVLGALAVAIALPFAIRSFRRTASELRARDDA